jgi:uncharacterized cysteine cluster protein YcgN (CxxCxxCC family)
MRDGTVRRVVKRVALARFRIDLWLTRALRRARGERPYRLGGDCRRCAACCEAPAIQAGRLVWHLPTLRRAFLAWQRVVNGFELSEREPAARLFVFRCTHFDPATRSCDSYDSRPGMCRDYPRALLWQPAPELLPGCGYRAVARNAESLRAALEARPLSAEQRARLRKGLYLEE